jgi:glycosyltransferase involved in cell wall biosynthesis
VKSTNLFVLPSLHDDCPLALLEALALGTPCLASRAGGIPEIMRYDDLMFDPLAEGSFAEKMDTAARDKEYMRHIGNLCASLKESCKKDWAEEVLSLQ